jgi:hypothetical protein
LDVIADVFSKELDDSLTKRAQQKGILPTAESVDATYLNENAAVNLEDILSNSSLVKSGQVKLLGLGKLKLKMGSKWLSLIASIHDHMNSIIKKHIGPKDVFFNKSDEEFIIVFATTENQAAKLISAKILQELTEKFAGSVDTEDIIVKTAIETLDGDVIFKDNDLKSLLEQFKKDEAKRGRYNKPGSKTAKKAKSDFKFVYEPVWAVRNETITTYMVDVVSGFGKNSKGFTVPKKIGHKVLGTQNSRKDKFKLDLFILKNSLSTLKKMQRKKVKSIFNIPVSYDSIFKSDALVEYVAQCKDITQALKKYIIFTLRDVPRGIPASKLEFITASLGKYSAGMVLQSAKGGLDLKRYTNSGINIIAIDILEYGKNIEKAWQKIEPFIEECHLNKFQVAILNVNTVEELMLARKYMADYIFGRGVGALEQSPGHMKRIKWHELLEAL